jgi:hypothetical protein
VSDELILEMARLNIQWEVSALPLESIVLGKFVPITSSLTEDVFVGHLHAMGNAVILAQKRLALALTSNPQFP